MSFVMSFLSRVVVPVLLTWLVIFYCLPQQQPVPPFLRQILGPCEKLPKRQLRVGITPWAGFAGGLLANGGFHFNKVAQSRWDSKLGVEFLNIDGFDSRERMLSESPCEGVDVLWSTVESWAGELPRFAEHGIDARAIMQIAHPSHAYPLVTDPKIRDLDDLGRSRLVVPLLSPEHWLLQGLPKKYWDTIAPVATDSALDEFAGEEADAIALSECEEYKAFHRRRGSKRLFELEGEVNYILIARETSIEQAPALFKDFVQKWLEGNKYSHGQLDLTTRLIHDNPLVSDESKNQISAELDHANIATLEENMSMFGLDGGIAAFDKHFADASKQWIRWKFLLDPQVAENAKDDRPLLEVFNEHPAVPSIKQLCDPGVNVERDPSPVIVRFKTGESNISPEFDSVLSDVMHELKTRHVQACIEGYTDRTGGDGRNKELSFERAQAVVDYLRSRLGVAQGRMFPEGKGSAKPLKTDEQSRRAEIRIVWEGK